MGSCNQLHSSGKSDPFFGTSHTNVLDQIIINRISLISQVHTTVNRVRIATAVFITIINITVIATFIPAVLQVSPRYFPRSSYILSILATYHVGLNELDSVITGGIIWVKITKILIMFTDAFLNFYFISEVKDNLVRNGLQKYDKLCQFNMGIIIVSILFDVSLTYSRIYHSSPFQCSYDFPTILRSRLTKPPAFPLCNNLPPRNRRFHLLHPSNLHHQTENRTLNDQAYQKDSSARNPSSPQAIY
jgi:hypothetical protein